MPCSVVVVEGLILARLRKRVRERHPCVAVAVRKSEPFRHHADDAEQIVVEPHVLADDVRAGPERVVQSRWLSRITRSLPGTASSSVKPRPYGRRHAEHGQEATAKRASPRSLLHGASPCNVRSVRVKIAASSSAGACVRRSR